MSGESTLSLAEIIDCLDRHGCHDYADAGRVWLTRIAALVEACDNVADFIEGSLPVKGWLRDCDASRKALDEMVKARKEVSGG